MNSIIVKVYNQSKLVQAQNLVINDFHHTTIQATQTANYEFIDTLTNKAPKQISSRRQDNDLIISFDKNTEVTDLTIKDFYQYNDSGLMGLADNGEYYNYVPTSAEISDYVSEIQTSDIVSHILGGQAYANPWWMGANQELVSVTHANSSSIVSNWFVGAMAVGGIAAAILAQDKEDKKTHSPDIVNDGDTKTDDTNNTTDNPDINTDIPPASIIFDNITTDNIINIIESQADITVTGRTTNVDNGTSITLKVGTAEYQGIVNNNRFNVNVDGKTLAVHQKITAELNNVSVDKNYTVDTDISQPVIHIDNVTQDNNLDYNEAKQVITITGTVSQVADGSKLNATIGDSTFITEVNDGKFELIVNGSLLSQHTSITTSISVTDEAGNTATSNQSHTYNVDLTEPKTPIITINNVTEDNVVNIAESQTFVPISGNVSNLIENQEVKVVCGCPTCSGVVDVEKSALVDANGNFTVNFDGDAVAKGSTITVSVEQTDNNIATENSKTYEKDLVAPEVTINIHTIANDNTINDAESKQDITLTGDISGLQPEDKATLTLIINNKEYPATIDTNQNSYQLTLTGSELADSESTTIQAKLMVTDPAGNSAITTADKTYNVDTQTQASITIDDINNGDIINSSTASNQVTLTGNLTYDTDVNSDDVVVTVTINSGLDSQVSFDTAEVNGNTWSLTIDGSKLVQNQGNNTVSASIKVTDSVGNTTSAQTEEQTYQVDTLVNTSITLDPISTDNVLSLEEVDGLVTVSGQVTGDFTVGDKVTLLTNGTNSTQSITAKIQSDGRFSTQIKGENLANDVDNIISASLTTTDAVGNTSTVIAKSDPYIVEQAENISLSLNRITNDNFINVTEEAGNINISGTASANNPKNAIGQMVDIIVGNQTYSAQIQSDLTFNLALAGELLANTQGYQITAQLQSDNKVTAKQSYRVDDYVAADIDITSIITKDTVHDGSEYTRISGSVDLSNTLFNEGLNSSRVKAIELKIGDKLYQVGINEETQKFYADILTSDIQSANGESVSYRIITADKVYQLSNNSIFTGSGYNKDIFIIDSPTLTQENTPITLDSDNPDNSVFINTNGQYKIDSTSINTSDLQSKVTGTVEGAATGDTVIVAVNDQEYTTKVQSDKTFSVFFDTLTMQTSPVDTNQMPQNITATLQTTDLNGQAVTVSDTTQYTTASHVTDAMQIFYTNDKGVANRVDSYDDLPYFIQALSIEAQNDEYNYKYSTGRLSGYEYGNQNGTKNITYYLKTANEAKGHVNTTGEALTESVDFSQTNQTAIKNALSKLSEYIDVTFEEVNSAEDADFNYYMTNINNGINFNTINYDSYKAGYAFFGGDVYLATEIYGDVTTSLGSLDSQDGFISILHETMHTLGASHPFTESSRPNTTILEDNTESVGITLMSYKDQEDFVDTEDLRLYDLAFLQYRYGVNPDARSGNDTYGFKTFNQNTSDNDIYIWDGAGVDTFNAANEMSGVYVDLTPGSMSYRGDKASVQANNSNLFAVKGVLATNNSQYFEGEISNSDQVAVVEKINPNDDNSNYTLYKDGVEEVFDFTEDQVMIGYNTQIENITGSAYADTLIGNKAHNIIYAGAGNDTVNAGEGNDYIDGGKGNDSLLGGLGDDIYVIDSKQDVVTELSNQGTDMIISSSDYTLTDNIEKLLLIDEAKVATGNQLDNHLIGNNQDNILNGADGNDTLTGGRGSDTLTGGKGQDTFVFADILDGSIDTITDLSVGDVIQLSANIFNSLTTDDNSDIMQYINYDSTTGALSYDSDANGNVDAIQFATLTSGLSIDKDYFVVI